MVPAFGDLLGGNGGIGGRNRLEAPFADIVCALLQRLGMADNGPDPGERRAGEPQQVMANFQIVYAVDEKRPLEHDIDNLGDFAGVAVFDGQHGTVAFAVYHRIVGGAKIRKGDLVRIRKNAFGGNVGKGAFYAAVSDRKSLLKHLLVSPRDIHIALKKVYVVGTDGFIRNKGGVFDDHLVFPPPVKNGQAMRDLIFGDLGHLGHALLKELRHFLIDGVYVLSGFLKLVHLAYSSANFLKAGSARRICSVETQ